MAKINNDDFVLESGERLYIDGTYVDAIATGAPTDSATTLLTGSALGAVSGSYGLFSEDANSNIIGGTGAGGSLTTGANNFLAGVEAGKFNTTGDGNLSVGYQASYYPSAGDYNIVMGYQANYGQDRPTFAGVDYNIIMGYQAAYEGLQTDNHQNNIIMGNSAGYRMGSHATNTTTHNVAIGTQAGYGGAGDGNDFSYCVLVGTSTGKELTTGDYNTIVGYSAGAQMTTGSRNALFGYSAGANLVDDNYNTAIGSESMQYTYAGANNTAVGRYALKGIFGSTTASNNNTCVGYGAGSNVIGLGNTCIGSYALEGGNGESFTIQYNTAIGFEAMGIGLADQPSGATQNVAIGYQTLYRMQRGDNNIAIGDEAMAGAATGTRDIDQNIAIGDRALYGYATDGMKYNIAIGYQSGNFMSSTGTTDPPLYNIFMGYQAGYNTGRRATSQIDYNTFVGYRAGWTIGGRTNDDYPSTDTQSNVAIGTDALYGPSAGSYNVAIGRYAMRSGATDRQTDMDNNVAIGNEALTGITEGANNVAIGYQAGDTIDDGDGNTFIGYQADGQYPGQSNSIALGNGATASTANYVRIGNASISAAAIEVDWTITSDKRVKTNVEDNYVGLDFITKLNPKRFNKVDIKTKEKFDGLIAQEVKEVMDELGIEFSGWRKDPGEDGMQSLAYSSFVMPLINAVKELKDEIDELKKNK